MSEYKQILPIVDPTKLISGSDIKERKQTALAITKREIEKIIDPFAITFNAALERQSDFPKQTVYAGPKGLTLAYESEIPDMYTFMSLSRGKFKKGLFSKSTNYCSQVVMCDSYEQSFAYLSNKIMSYKLNGEFLTINNFPVQRRNIIGLSFSSEGKVNEIFAPQNLLMGESKSSEKWIDTWYSIIKLNNEFLNVFDVSREIVYSGNKLKYPLWDNSLDFKGERIFRNPIKDFKTSLDREVQNLMPTLTSATFNTEL